MTKDAHDVSLAQRHKQGDESAFDEIVELYTTDVAALAARLLGWVSDVDDVTQEVFLSAYMGLKKFRCECSLRTWLFTITANKCRTHRYRRMLRFRHISAKLDPARHPESAAPPAERNCLDAEASRRVRDAVGDLPPKHREAVVLRYLQQLPTEQICTILGITTNTLNVRLNRARERLRLQLTDLPEQ